MPQLTGLNTRGRRLRPRKPLGWFGTIFISLFMLVEVAAMAAFVVYTADQFGYRAGWQGTAGTVSVLDCEQKFDSHGTASWYCTGDFRSATGGPVAHDLSIEGDYDLTPGAALPAREHDDGQSVSLTGRPYVAYMLAGLFGTLAMLVASISFLLGAIGAIMTKLGRPRSMATAAKVPLIASAVLGVCALVAVIIAANS